MVKTLANCIRDIIKISVENKVEGIKIFFSAPNPRHPDSDTLNLKDKKSVEANFQWIAYQILFRKNDKYYIYNTVLEPNGLEKNPPSDKVFESDSNWSGKNKNKPAMDLDIGEIRRSNPGILKGPNLFPEKYGQTIYTNTSSDDRDKSYSSEEFKKLFNNDFYIVLNPKKKELKNPFGEDIGIKYPGKEEVKKAKVGAYPNNIIKVEPIIVGGESLPEILLCGDECKHLSSDKKDCYLFRCSINMKRCKSCVSFVEGTM